MLIIGIILVLMITKGRLLISRAVIQDLTFDVLLDGFELVELDFLLLALIEVVLTQIRHGLVFHGVDSVHRNNLEVFTTR